MKILIIAFQSGTHGNLLAKSLVRLNPASFCLKENYKNNSMKTDNGTVFYHSLKGWFDHLFYIGTGPDVFLGTEPLSSERIHNIQEKIKSSDEYTRADPHKYHIVLTHMYQDDELKNLNAVFENQAKILKIIYKKETIDFIANRFFDIYHYMATGPAIPMVDIINSLTKNQTNTSIYTTVEFEKISNDDYLSQVIGSL